MFEPFPHCPNCGAEVVGTPPVTPLLARPVRADRSRLKQNEDELRKRTVEVFKRENAAEKGEVEVAGRGEELSAAQAELVSTIARAAQTGRQPAEWETSLKKPRDALRTGGGRR
jgi:hypothetical protein